MRAVAIDLFGTIIKPESDELAHKALAEELARIHGNQLNPDDLLKEYWRLVNEGLESAEATWSALNILAERLGFKIRVSRDEVEHMHIIYHSKHAILFEDALQALGEARKLFQRTALLTDGDGPVVHAIVDALGIRRYFDVIVTRSDVNARKPDPKLFIECLRRLGGNPSSTVMIGDRCADVEGAKDAGMLAVVVREVSGCRREPDGTAEGLLNAVRLAYKLVSETPK